jgi:hypothetical protein
VTSLYCLKIVDLKIVDDKEALNHGTLSPHKPITIPGMHPVPDLDLFATADRGGYNLRDRSISLIPTRHGKHSHAVPRAPRPYAERAQARIRQVSMPNIGKYLHAHCQQQ